MTAAADHNTAYCYAVLPRVSRTFALNIRILPEPLRRSVTVAYLLFRIADTVEDTAGLPRARRRVLFDRLADMLRAAADGRADAGGLALAELAEVLEFPVTPGEADLMRNRGRVAAVYADLPATVRQILARWLLETIDGMEQMHKIGERIDGNGRAGRPKCLQTPQDLDLYCWYVAGTVGMALTELFADHSGATLNPRDPAVLHDAESFGRALQLTNILQDIASDFADGRCYLPEDWLREENVPPAELLDESHRPASHRVVKRVARRAFCDLMAAMRYTLRIPAGQRRLRVFCLWPMLAALRTLGLIVRGKHTLMAGKRPKISRRRLYQDMALSVALAGSDGRLRGYFRHIVGTDYPESWSARTAELDGPPAEPPGERVKALLTV
jgi:farnesyl-diphosphate farnesyltransferase